MEHLATSLNGDQSLTVIAKLSILDVYGNPWSTNWKIDPRDTDKILNYFSYTGFLWITSQVNLVFNFTSLINNNNSWINNTDVLTKLNKSVKTPTSLKLKEVSLTRNLFEKGIQDPHAIIINTWNRSVWQCWL